MYTQCHAIYYALYSHYFLNFHKDLCIYVNLSQLYNNVCWWFMKHTKWVDLHVVFKNVIVLQ